MHYCANAPRSARRHLSLTLSAALTMAVVGSGCQTMTTAKTGIDTGLSTAQSTKSTADTTKQLGTDLKGEVDKAMGKKGEGGAAGAGDKEDEDGKRLQAKSSKLNQPVNDELNQTKFDVTDWKAYDLSGIAAGKWVEFVLNWDEPDAEINLDIYDQVGAQVVQSPGRAGVPQKNVPLRVLTPGIYYARLTLQPNYPKKESVYTVVLKTGKNAALAKPTSVSGKKEDPAAAAAAAPGAAGGAPGAPGAPGAGGMPGQPGGMPGQPQMGAYPQMGAMPGGMGGYPQMGMMPGGMPGAMPGGMPGAMPGGAAPAAAGGAAAGGAAAGGDSSAIPEDAIVGRIVQSTVEDSKRILYLDKGSKSKLRVGMKGNILQGKEGGQKLDGGTFTITKVLGDNQAVGSTDYGKSLGSNNRFMILKAK